MGYEAFAVIRDAMKGKGMVALGRIVVSKRERVIALEPHGKGLIGTTLHYPYEVRKSEEYFEEIPDVKVPGEMLKLAEHILETKEADFVKKGKEEVAAPRNVISLMDALRRSIETESRAPAPSKKARKKMEGQKEMLLPIEGKQSSRETAKKPAKSSARQRKAG